ncbi:MAG: glycosyltransferase family 4 protein [Gammaproteobacteria bacterium]
MKIVHLETGRHLYGGARQVCRLLEALTEFQNVLICRPKAEIASAVGAQVRVVEMPMYGDLDLRARARLQRVLSDERGEVLHVHSRAGADRFGARAARTVGMHSVLTRRVDNPEPRLWARYKFRGYDAIAAISTPILEWLRNDLRIPGDRVTQIASGVDPEAFADREAARAALVRRFGINPDAFVLGAAGQLISRKGHDVLLEALPTVFARHRGARLVLFGRGPRDAALKSQARRLGIFDHVVFAGFVPRLEELLAGFDVFVHPARSEGLGLIVLEAQSAGVPVVASRAGGLVDAIDDERSGLLVPTDEPPALTSALLRLLEDEPLRRRLGEAGRSGVAAQFTVQAMADGYRVLYANLVRTSRAS